MKKFVLIFLWLLGSTICLKAQYAYEVQLEPSYYSNNLILDFKIKSLGSSSFPLGSSEFVVELSTSGLDINNVQLLDTGSYFSPSNDPSAYASIDLGKRDTMLGILLMAKISEYAKGMLVDNQWRSLGQLAFPILDPCKKASVSWSASRKSVTVLTSGKKAPSISENGTYSSPETIRLDDSAYVVQPSVSINNTELVSSHGLIMDWYLDGVPLSITDSVFKPMIDGDYQVEVQNICGEKFISPSIAYRVSGLSSESEGISVKVLPNPMHSKGELLVMLNETQNASIQIFNSKGDFVTTLFEGTMSSGNNSLPINALNLGLKAGIYIAKITFEKGGELATKFVVVK